MFALLAVFVFALGLLLTWLGTSTGKFSLLYLGLMLLAAQWAFEGWVGTPWARRQRP